MRGYKWLAVLIAALMLVTTAQICNAAGNDANSPRRIAAKSFPSVALLIMMDKRGKPVSIGSGFVVAPGVLATNYHVIQGAAKGKLKFVGEDREYPIIGAVGLDVWADVALVKIDDATHPALPIGISGRVAVGDRVFVIGNPKGLVGTFSEGLISAIRRVKKSRDYAFQMSAPISKGSSGGPVVNSEGEVVGLSRSILMTGQNLNFAVPASYVVGLLGNMTSPRTLRSIPVVTKRRGGRTTKQSAGPKPELLMGPGIEGVALTNFLWSTSGFGRFSFSIKNIGKTALSSVELHAVYYDSKGEVVDNHRWRHNGGISPRMAVRTERGVKKDLLRLTSKILVSATRAKTR